MEPTLWRNLDEVEGVSTLNVPWGYLKRSESSRGTVAAVCASRSSPAKGSTAPGWTKEGDTPSVRRDNGHVAAGKARDKRRKRPKADRIGLVDSEGQRPEQRYLVASMAKMVAIGYLWR